MSEENYNIVATVRGEKPKRRVIVERGLSKEAALARCSAMPLHYRKVYKYFKASKQK